MLGGNPGGETPLVAQPGERQWSHANMTCDVPLPFVRFTSSIPFEPRSHQLRDRFFVVGDDHYDSRPQFLDDFVQTSLGFGQCNGSQHWRSPSVHPTISRPRKVPLPVENSLVSMPSRCSIETNKLVSE